jgi:hypothetical protein
MGTGQRLAHDLRRQFGGCTVFQAAAKGTNGSAHGTDYNNVSTHNKLQNVEKAAAPPWFAGTAVLSVNKGAYMDDRH